MKNDPFSITIFVVDGVPDGLKTVEKTNWDGFGIVCPRAQYPSAKDRNEFGRGGVYILVGEEDEDEIIYIGKTDVVRERLNSHYADPEKEFWQKAIVFMRKGDSHPLGTTESGYLEACLVEKARKNRRCTVKNANNPQKPNMSEAEEATAKIYLSEMLLLLPVLGISAFEEISKIIPRGQENYIFKGKDWSASGHQSSRGFSVQKGSTASPKSARTIPSSDEKTRKKLTDKKIWVLDKDKNVFRFANDFEFNSPSAAASVVSGSRKSGHEAWKLKDKPKITLGKHLALTKKKP